MNRPPGTKIGSHRLHIAPATAIVITSSSSLAATHLLVLFRKQELLDLQGKATGLREEGEIITLQVVPFEDLWRQTADAKALSALALYDRLMAAGLIPEAEE